MSAESIEDIAWELSMLAEERGRMIEKVVEEVEANEKEFLEDPQGEECEEGKDLDEAIGFQTKEEVLAEEACIGHEIIEESPPYFKVLLSKAPFADLCQDKAKPSTIPLGGCDGSQSMMEYMVWGKEEEEEKEKERSRGWRLHLTQVQESSSNVIPYAHDFRLHLDVENLNFKEVLGWTKT
ncbi:unnamed protein product [Linum trigynum]|uniref:Uncharacterized protein n=1 Tax=Linum trigynum TaxID=586398 RepID=A0AAV2CWG5_9ROSI